jgi:hypothetical protein
LSIGSLARVSEIGEGKIREGFPRSCSKLEQDLGNPALLEQGFRDPALIREGFKFFSKLEKGFRDPALIREGFKSCSKSEQSFLILL